MKLLAILFLFAVSGAVSLAENVCNIHCDDRDYREARGDVREPVGVNIDYRGRIRRVCLRISDEDNMGYAEIRNGEPGDEAWIERTFNGEWSQDGPHGKAVMAPGRHEVYTNMFNVDNPSGQQIGALRACAHYVEANFTTCTQWARSKVNAENKLDAAITSLMMFYEPWRGLFRTVGWWNGANDVTVLIDYQRVTGRDLYFDAINNTFELNKDENQFGGWNFTFGSIDDNLWWGLAWLRAYDLTAEQKYLDMAVFIADYCWDYHDDVCGGGVWWSDRKTYKNAVTNEQYIKLAAQLHNRIQGDTKYLQQATGLWTWFRNSGMINSENLINDGLDNCTNNGQKTHTYNQGIILGALVELHQATDNQTYLDEALKIARAVMASPVINDEYGVLFENCGEPDCGPNAACFKGIFMRNLGELYEATRDPEIKDYILKVAQAVYTRDRTPLDQYGVNYSGPFDFADASRMQSAIDALIAEELVKRLG